jgi:NAD(P)-dependent dehydrogenase (short-subunit alcohol dehydrogenase family)
MSPLVKRESVFISGGTSGLGLHIAEHFSRLGNPVVFCGRDQATVSNIESHLKLISPYNQVVLGYRADVTNLEEISTIFAELNALQMNVEILICNAGAIGPIDKFLKCDLQKWQSAFNVNLYGTINLITEALPRMLSQGAGRVIHISGGGATSPLFGMSSYAASKAAAVRFIETLSLEYQDSGVTFNSVAPGMLKTQLLDQMLDAGPERIGANLFTKSLAKAESSMDSRAQVIELIDFLVSEASGEITGKLISAEWDNWGEWQRHLLEIKNSDLYTLRRITGRDRGHDWGDL